MSCRMRRLPKSIRRLSSSMIGFIVNLFHPRRRHESPRRHIAFFVSLRVALWTRHDSLFRRRLRRRRGLFFGLRQRDIPVDASDRDLRPASPYAGAVAAIAFLVFALLEIRQVGVDPAVVAARVDVGVDFADEAKSGVAVDAVQVDPAARREFGDGRVNLAVDVPERRPSGRLRDVDLSIEAPNVNAAFNLADGHVAVDAVGYERDFARQLQYYALAAFGDRAERREEAAPVSLEADAKLARVVQDSDLAVLQVFALLCGADDQDLGVVGLGGLDVYTPVDAGDDDVCAGLERIAPANLLALG